MNGRWRSVTIALRHPKQVPTQSRWHTAPGTPSSNGAWVMSVHAVPTGVSWSSVEISLERPSSSRPVDAFTNARADSSPRIKRSIKAVVMTTPWRWKISGLPSTTEQNQFCWNASSVSKAERPGVVSGQDAIGVALPPLTQGEPSHDTQPVVASVEVQPQTCLVCSALGAADVADRGGQFDDEVPELRDTQTAARQARKHALLHRRERLPALEALHDTAVASDLHRRDRERLT